MNDLVTPATHHPCRVAGESIVCESTGERYPIVNGIVNYLNHSEGEKWDAYHTEIYSGTPIPPQTYYARFAAGWGKMLDLGCGDGAMSAAAAPYVRDIFCVNPGITALKILQSRGLQNLHPVCAFGEQLPFRNSFFDGVLNVFVIEHIENPLPMLTEVRRVLRPEGRLVIATDTSFYYKFLRPLLQWRDLGFRNGWRKWTPNDPTHINMMAPARLRSYVQEAGFEIESEHIHFLTGKWRWLFGALPHTVYERMFSTMSVLVCRPESR